MELNWFEHLLYGLISGFSELLPISSVAHQAVFTTLAGGTDYPWLQLSCHIGILLALVMVFVPTLSRMRRERRIARTPKKRRRRQPDFATVMEIKVLRTVTISMLVCFAAYGYVYDLYERLWLLAIFLGINGVLLYLPQYLPGANKRAESLSKLDGCVIGVSAGFGIIPGFSRLGMATCAAQVRGTDRQYAVEIALMSSMPALLVLCVLDLLAGSAAAVTVSGLMIFGCLTAGLAAFVAAYFAIALVRFLAVKTGFSGFAYYCWGLAMFTLIIYLI